MVKNEGTIRLYHPTAKIFLDYDLSILSEILDLIRNGEDSVTAKMLQEYEHKLIETERLAQIANAKQQEMIELGKIERDLT